MANFLCFFSDFEGTRAEESLLRYIAATLSFLEQHKTIIGHTSVCKDSNLFRDYYHDPLSYQVLRPAHATKCSLISHA